LKKKNIDDFCTASIAYIIKSYNSFYFIVLNKNTKYISNPIKDDIKKEFDNILAILFDDINEKMKNCEQ
jgi:hypothetical protein